MKKALLITISLILSWGCYAQIERLSQKEIKECETPRAVAYKFVKYDIDRNTVGIAFLSTELFYNELQEWAQSAGVNSLKQLLTRDYMHDIVDMGPVVKMGYDIVISDSYILDLDKHFAMYGKPNPYKGCPGFSVSFTCADANNNIYDGTYGNYDVTARVLLVNYKGGWKVFGFK